MKKLFIMTIASLLLSTYAIASSPVWSCIAHNTINGATWSDFINSPTEAQAMEHAITLCQHGSVRRQYDPSACAVAAPCSEFFQCSAVNSRNGARWEDGVGSTEAEAIKNAIRLCEYESVSHRYSGTCRIIGACAQP